MKRRQRTEFGHREKEFTRTGTLERCKYIHRGTMTGGTVTGGTVTRPEAMPRHR